MARTSAFLSAVAIVLCLPAIALFLSCSGSGGVDVDDDTYPSAVTDLRVRAVTPTTVTLEWTAPGDVDTVGTAAAYDMRFSKSEITWQNWDSQTHLNGEPQPSPYGATDTMRVTGLEEDSTYFFALMSRGHSGTWSWLSNCAMAVCFDDFEVTFPDPILEGIIRAAIGIPTGAIHRSDLLPVQIVDANDSGVADLAGVQYCTNVREAFMTGNLVGSLTPLAGLVKMIRLQMADNRISDIGPLADMVNLEQLILGNNTISDISAMTNMTNLTDVRLAGNQITDIAALQGLTGLQLLVLSGNQIIDIAPLVANTGIDNGDIVYLYGNPLSSESINTHIPALRSRGVTVYF